MLATGGAELHPAHSRDSISDERGLECHKTGSSAVILILDIITLEVDGIERRLHRLKDVSRVWSRFRSTALPQRCEKQTRIFDVHCRNRCSKCDHFRSMEW